LISRRRNEIEGQFLFFVSFVFFVLACAKKKKKSPLRGLGSNPDEVNLVLQKVFPHNVGYVDFGVPALAEVPNVHDELGEPVHHLAILLRKFLPLYEILPFPVVSRACLVNYDVHCFHQAAEIAQWRCLSLHCPEFDSHTASLLNMT